MSTWRTRLGGEEFKVQRLQDAPFLSPPTITTPQAVADYIEPRLAESLRHNADCETMAVIAVNTRRQAIGWNVVSNGTLDTLLVHAREIFKYAIVLNAAALIIVHNHPSGDPTPSEADIKITRDLIRAGQLLKIEVLDHVILGRASAQRPKSWASLRELGYFYSTAQP